MFAVLCPRRGRVAAALVIQLHQLLQLPRRATVARGSPAGFLPSRHRFVVVGEKHPAEANVVARSYGLQGYWVQMVDLPHDDDPIHRAGQKKNSMV